MRKAKGGVDFVNIAKEDENYEMTPGEEGEPGTRVFSLTIKAPTKEMAGDQYKCKPKDGHYEKPLPIATLIEVEDKSKSCTLYRL